MFGLVKKSELDKEKFQNRCLNGVIEGRENYIETVENELSEKAKECENLMLLNKQKDSNIAALNDEIKGLKDKVKDLHLANKKLTNSRELVSKDIARSLLREVDLIAKDIQSIKYANIGMDDYSKREDVKKLTILGDNILFLSPFDKGIVRFKELLKDVIENEVSL